MSWSLSLMVLVGFAANEMSNVSMFDSYTTAYQTAQKTHRPMLVILNPSEDSEEHGVSLSEITESEQNRDLLKNYVVTVIDAESEHGKKCQKLFEAKTLPHVVVIDKEQKFQIYKTSQDLDSKVWTTVLRKYQDGKVPQPVASPIQYHRPQSYSYPSRGYCPTCR